MHARISLRKSASGLVGHQLVPAKSNNHNRHESRDQQVHVYATPKRQQQHAVLVQKITYDYIYNMKVVEKCNVHSFSVLALDVIKGKHPGDFLLEISPSSSN
ncbi:hypothetical protein WN943_025881 [Citrus x changshan-huyou]